MTSRLTLRAKLVLLVLLAVAPLVVLSVVGSVLTARNDVVQTTKNLEVSALLIATNQQRVADSARQMLSAIAYVPQLLAGNEVFCQQYFKALTSELEVYTTVGVLGTDGYMRCTKEPEKPKVFRGDRAYFQSALATGDFVASGYLISRVNGKPIIAFALPLKGTDGSTQAVAFASMYLSDIAKNMAAVSMPAGGHVILMDRDGTVLAASPEQATPAGKPLPIKLVTDAIKTGLPQVFEGPDAGGAQQIYAFRPSSLLPNSPFFVLVSANRSEVLTAAREELALSLSALVLITLLGIWMAWRLVGRDLVASAARVIEATSRIQAGALDVRLPVGPDAAGTEFTRIAAGFNSMAESIEAREQQQNKSFIELSQAQNQLLTAQKLGRMGYWELDLVNNRVSWSDELHHLFGLKPGEFDGDHATFLKMLHPEDRPGYEAQRAAAILNGTALDMEYRVITPSGDVRWIHHRGQLITDEAGAPIARSGMVQDITEQQAAREHLRLLETAVGQINDMVLITEAEPSDEHEHRIVFVNDAFERHMGYTREEVLGRSTRLLQGPATQKSDLQRIDRAVKAWQPLRIEVIAYTKSGQEFWVEVDFAPIANKDGRFTHWVSVHRDINQRKHAEQALMDSERRYTALFESAPVPMWVFDSADFRFLNVNRAAVNHYGYSVDEFLAMTIFDIRDPSEEAGLRKHLLGLEQERPYWQHRHKDGTVLLVNVVAKAIQYEGREACFVVSQDITAQVQAETGVQEQVFTLQRAADAAQAITQHQTIGGLLREVTEQARGVIGAHLAVVSLTPDNDKSPVISELSASDKFSGYGDPHEVSDGYRIYAMVRGTKRVVRMTQTELQAHPRWADLQIYAANYPALRGWLAVPLTGRDGQNIGLLQLSDRYEGEFTLQDEYVVLELAQLASTAIENARLLDQVNQLNTGLEQKVTERTLALSQQEALFRALAEQAPEVIWTSDNRGVASYFNRAWYDLVGGTPDDWIGRTGMVVTHPEDHAAIRASWIRAVITKSSFVGVRRFMGRDGSYHVMSSRASPVINEQGAVSFWVGIDADVTELKNIESALRLSNQELEAFSYSVSHDLRAPLNTVDGFSRLLVKHMAGDIDPKAQHYLTRIQAGVSQMGQLIEDLLSLAQVSRAELRRELTDLSVLSRQILGEWQARAPHRQVSLHIDPGLMAQGDIRLLKVLLENLLGNAWKFTSQVAHANITVSKQLDANGLTVFFVRDDGVGFDMAHANKLFEVFQRLHPVSEFPGTGVGLATVGRVIARHGGQIWADASPDQGATFFFTLPTMPAAPQGR